MTSKSSLFSSIVTLLLIAASLCLALSVTSCSLQPRGTTIFHIEGKNEYDKASLSFPETEEHRRPLKLRWVDTNTYTTTATLTPGQYHFAARTSDGMFYGREITIKEGVRRYDLPPSSAGTAGVAQGPAVTGSVTVASGKRPTQLVALFISTDITVRRVTSADGTFSVNAPTPGEYRFEMHGLGQPPRTFTRERLSVTAPVDLGSITLH